MEIYYKPIAKEVTDYWASKDEQKRKKAVKDF
jgi:hypothetical protein